MDTNTNDFQYGTYTNPTSPDKPDIVVYAPLYEIKHEFKVGKSIVDMHKARYATGTAPATAATAAIINESQEVCFIVSSDSLINAGYELAKSKKDSK